MVKEKEKKAVPPKAGRASPSEAGRETYFEGTGRRKTSVARVRICLSKKSEITVNDQPFENYFPTAALRDIVLSALKKAKLEKNLKITVKTRGGGIFSQAGALRHGIARALIKFDADSKPVLKKAGFLTRDPRMKERRKFGLKKARRAPQWSKR